jgi:hypothetical protein
MAFEGGADALQWVLTLGGGTLIGVGIAGPRKFEHKAMVAVPGLIACVISFFTDALNCAHTKTRI